MNGMEITARALSEATPADDDLLAAAATSSYYRGILKTAEPWPSTTMALHHKLVELGGSTKQGCFSTTNITCATHYASSHRGITSGRSGQRLDYRKPDHWIHIRDHWRRRNLLSRADGDYAVIHVASRLFPHDPDDITLACGQIDRSLQRCLLELLTQLRERGLTIFFRGFPARLQDTIEPIRAVCQQIGMPTIHLISTGTKLRQEQREALQYAIGNGQLITEYGAQDCGIQLYSCPECGAFHLENPRSLLSVAQNRLYATDRYSLSQPVLAMDKWWLWIGSAGTRGNGAISPIPCPAFQPRSAPSNHEQPSRAPGCSTRPRASC